jgi:uncharacterized membrane protein YfcA
MLTEDPAVAAILSAKTLGALWLGGFVGGFATGAAGFGYGVVAAAIWLHAMSPLHAAMLVVSGGLIIQAGTIWPLRRAIEPSRLLPFLAAGLIGVPVGVWFLVRIEPQTVRTVLGVFLAAYGAYALIAPRLPRIAGGGRVADAAVGFAGGVLGGIGGYSGVLPAIWCRLRGWPAGVSRAVYQPFILAAHLWTLTLIGVVAIDRAGLALLLLGLPAIAAGAAVGWRVYGALDEVRFAQILAGLLFISGLILAL